MWRYWIGFNRAKGIGPARLRALIDHFGDVERAWRAPQDVLRATGIFDSRSLEAFLNFRREYNPDPDLRLLDRLGCTLIHWDQPEYPPLLREIPDAPPLLYIRGTLTTEDHQRALAVVGTRRATEYGKTMTRQIVTALTQNGITIVSGLAVGIDSAAHRAALESGGRTLAVLPCGIDRLYPPGNESLAESITAHGALISEFPPGTGPERYNFPPRNRVISGLTHGVLVIEAAVGSGALITADRALDQGREVFAVPGNASSPGSAGTNALIQAGAGLVTGAEDVLQAFSWHLNAGGTVRPTPRAPDIREKMAGAIRNSPAESRSQPGPTKATQYTPATPVEAAIIRCLSQGAMAVDELVHCTGLPISQIASALTALEIGGVLEQVNPAQFGLATM